MKKYLLIVLFFLLFLCIGCKSKVDTDDIDNIITYDVLFDSNGGSDVLSQTIKSGNVIFRPDDPIKEGNTFDGWYVGDELWDFSNTINSNLTLKAHWVLNQYKVTIKYYDNNINEITFNYGDRINIEVPRRAGYIFDGWSIDIPNTMPAHNLEIEAKWIRGIEPKSYQFELLTSKSIDLSSLFTYQGDSELVYYADGAVEIVEDKVVGKVAGVGAVTISVKGVDNSTVQILIIVSDPEVTVEESSVLLFEDEVYKLKFTVPNGFNYVIKNSNDDVLELNQSRNEVKALSLGTSIVTISIEGFESSTANIEFFVEEPIEEYLEKDAYIDFIIKDLEDIYESILPELTDEQKTNVDSAYTTGLDNIRKSETISEARVSYNNSVKEMINCIPLANGFLTYSTLSNERKTEIIGILENYVVSMGITGLSFFENGSYVMFNPRVTLGSDAYIAGYGFGVLAEGNITSPLDYETNQDWKMYYHTFNSSDPNNANYLNDPSDEIKEFYNYFGASFYTNFMNDAKNGFDWIPELAISERPIAVNPDSNGMATTWKIEVRTGKTGLKYNTNSELRSKYNNRDVELEDYLTAFKLLLTKSNGLCRGNELAQTKSYPIVGAKEYYDGSEEGFNQELWDKVGLKVYEEEGKEYFEFTFGKSFTQFNAMYYISSSIYMPVPQEFLDEVTVENYLSFSNDTTPVDNSLSLGAYTLKSWDINNKVVYKKNPNYVYANEKYKIQGIVITILDDINKDPNFAVKEFLAGHIDTVEITQDYLNEYKNDPRTHQTTGDSNFKLSVNTTSQETWEYLFGENGVITQTKKEDYWDVKPYLSNKHFIRGLSYAIDRLTYASARGGVPTVSFFPGNYMLENGLAYNATDAHKKAINQLLEGTDGYGYSLQLAQDYFRIALSELELEGKIRRGTKDNPTILPIEIAWEYSNFEAKYHNEIKKYLEDAFNDETVSHGKYKLVVNFWVDDVWSDVYFKKMAVGQYDIAFGSIDEYYIKLLDVMRRFSTNPAISEGGIIYFGCDTNDVNAYPIIFDGKRWSYDGLYVASQQDAIIVDGANKSPYEFDYQGLELDTDGNYIATATFTYSIPEITEVEVIDVGLFNKGLYRATGKAEEFFLDSFSEGFTLEQSLSDDGKVLTVTVKVSKEIAQQLYQAYATACSKAGIEEKEECIGYISFDFYFNLKFNGDASQDNKQVDDYFE